MFKYLEHDTIVSLNETIRQISSVIAKEQKYNTTTEPEGSVNSDDERISKRIFTITNYDKKSHFTLKIDCLINTYVTHLIKDKGTTII